MSLGSSVPAKRHPDTRRRDLRLLRRVAGHDREAFEALYRAYHPRLQRYLSRYLRSSGAIEDVIHEVMLAVWQQADRFREASRVSTWIFGIAYHKALEELRRASNRPFAVPSERLELSSPPVESHPGLRVALEQALARLPEEQRTAVELTYIQGHSYPEIARLMDCPVNTVKTRMFHARRKLRGMLATALNEEDS
jgi:RNA polymerase sigma factor (sigma-70 family)